MQAANDNTQKLIDGGALRPLAEGVYIWKPTSFSTIVLDDNAGRLSATLALPTRLIGMQTDFILEYGAGGLLPRSEVLIAAVVMISLMAASIVILDSNAIHGVTDSEKVILSMYAASTAEQITTLAFMLVSVNANADSQEK